jgi:hypothetical protein
LATLAPRRQLVSAARDGGITLVLGAGVSMPRGIPGWDTLAKKVWRRSLKDLPNPWSRQRRSLALDLPQFLPIVFELAYQRLGEPAFFDLLKRLLYRKANLPFTDRRLLRSNESLAVVARLLVAEYRRKSGRRISSVITLNADDFLEQAVARAAGIRGQLIEGGVIGAITRSTHRLLPSATIPVYHVHGFLPSDLWTTDTGPRRMLVFTDLQYWATSATAASFANRIVSAALSEGRCIFIGVSMKDINLLRWLALRGLDRERDQIDFAQKRMLRWISPEDPDESRDAGDLLQLARSFLNDPATSRSRSLDKNFNRHFWVRPRSTDPDGFLSRFLDECRGVRSVEIASWRGPAFRRLMTRCFPRKSDNQKRARR